MLAKGAETLPAKVAHDYKALAVTNILYRNSMMLDNIRRDSRMLKKF